MDYNFFILVLIKSFKTCFLLVTKIPLFNNVSSSTALCCMKFFQNTKVYGTNTFYFYKFSVFCFCFIFISNMNEK